ncbi:MAG: hypothetical protein C4K49_01475 [Candidatus Thorarchaeota archaeon]|nr:MAG: hypothetical protein C4K49_01475 [Candidatus Thorarchaeota archaeon]
MTKSRVQVGVIGTGNIGKAHLTSILSLKECRLLDVDVVAVCDSDPDSLKGATEFFGIPKGYRSFKDLVVDKDVDVAYVCTPTNLHPEMVRAIAKANKPVFCEKPLAHTHIQANDLLTVTRKARVPTGIGLVLRFDQFLLYAKSLIQTHNLGTPMLMHIRDDQGFPVGFMNYSQWRGDRKAAGGGTLIEHSIHDIDLFRWFFGEVESVYAKVGFYADKEVEDHASVILTHKTGAVSTLDSVWHWVERPSERMIELFFEKGYIAIHLGSDERYLEFRLQGKDSVKVTKEMADPALLDRLGLESKDIPEDGNDVLTALGGERYAALNYSFLSSVQQGKKPSPDFADAVEAHKVVDAAYESSRQSSRIELE